MQTVVVVGAKRRCTCGRLWPEQELAWPAAPGYAGEAEAAADTGQPHCHSQRPEPREAWPWEPGRPGQIRAPRTRGAEQNAVNPPPSRTLLVTTKLKLFLLLRSKKKIVLFLRTARLPLVQLNCPESRLPG